MKRTRADFSVVWNATNTAVYSLPGSAIRKRTALPELKNIVKEVRNGNNDAKRLLPAVCWAAKFNDQKRHKESAEWTGLAYIDIDHVSQFYDEAKPFGLSAAVRLYLDKCEGREDELGIVHAQVSPSGDGLHIIFIPETFNSMEEAQAAFAKKAGIERYDATCKDLSRMLFLSPLEDTLYDALDTLYDD